MIGEILNGLEFDRRDESSELILCPGTEMVRGYHAAGLQPWLGSIVVEAVV